MSADAFIDTNVFVYLFDDTDEDKRRRAEAIVYGALAEGTGCISFQVVQETLNVVVRKLGATPENAGRLLDDVLIPLWRVDPTVSLYRRGLQVQSRYKLGFYDALIVAGALEAGCKTLYSEDLQHGQRIAELSIVNPFEASDP